jgi:hypothetical protein
VAGRGSKLIGNTGSWQAELRMVSPDPPAHCRAEWLVARYTPPRRPEGRGPRAEALAALEALFKK